MAAWLLRGEVEDAADDELALDPQASARFVVAYEGSSDSAAAHLAALRREARTDARRAPGRRPVTQLINAREPRAPLSVGVAGRVPTTVRLGGSIARKADGGDIEAGALAAVARARSGTSTDLGALRPELEARFGVDLRAVRVYRGPDADRAARALGAKAFAVGTELFFRDGAYDAESIEGQRLIAHEVAHAIRGLAAPVDAPAITEPGDAEEQAADAMAEAFVHALHGDGAAPPWPRSLPREHALVHGAIAEPGADLPAPVRHRFAPGLRADLSGVTVHTGPASAAAAAALGTRAFAVGSQIHFATGAYDPASPAGRRLLAHELAHTAQPGAALPVPGEPLTLSAESDAHEREAERFAGTHGAVHHPDSLSLVQPVELSATRPSLVSLAPPPAPGHSAPAGGLVIRIGDVQLFERQMASKVWKAGTGSKDLIKKQISVRGIPLDLTLTAKADASAILSGSYGAGVIKDAIVELDATDPLFDMAPVLMANETVAREMLGNSPGARRASGALRVPANGLVNVMAAASAEPKIGKDPVAFGLTGGLTALGRATLDAEAAAGVAFTFGNGGATLVGAYDLDALLKVSFTLSAFLGVFVEVDFSKDFDTPGKKKQRSLPPGVPGMNSIPTTKPPGWPKEIPWILPEPGNPMKPGNDKWRKEWKKNWVVADHRWSHPWELDGAITVSSMMGMPSSAMHLPDTPLPMSAVIDDLFAAAAVTGTDPDNVDKEDEREEKPTAADLEAAKAKFEGTAHEARMNVTTEVEWNDDQLRIADRMILTATGELQEKWRAAKQTLAQRKEELDGTSTSLTELETRAHSAAAAKDGDQPARAQALAVLIELDANAKELVDIQARLPRPATLEENDDAKHVEACLQLMKDKVTEAVTLEKCKSQTSTTVAPSVAAAAASDTSLRAELLVDMRRVIEQDGRIDPHAAIAAAIDEVRRRSFAEFEATALAQDTSPTIYLRCVELFKEQCEAEAPRMRGHTKGIIERSDGLLVIIVVELDNVFGPLVDAARPAVTDALEEYFSAHDLDPGLQGDIRAMVDGTCRDKVREIVALYEDDLHKVVQRSDEVRGALVPIVDGRWAEAGDAALRDAMGLVNPRAELVGRAVLADYEKHMFAISAATEKEAQSIAASKPHAQYWRVQPDEIARRTLMNAPWERGGSTVHAYLDVGLCGFDGTKGSPGAPCHIHRAELTQGGEAGMPAMHGHPRPTRGG